MRELSVRMSERICFLIREFRSSPHKLRVTMVPTCVFYMAACDSGRVFFGSVSFARTKEMNSLRKSEKMHED